jgi:Rrf2 family protein
MLRLTKKADYGLMALKFIAQHSDSMSLSAKDIAEAYHIPPQLLAKILQRLAKEGLLRSHAGMNGGYTLSRRASDITAFEVIRAIDGPLFITSCVTDSGLCDLTNSCTIKEPLARVNDSISNVLKDIRISDLVDSDQANGHPKTEQDLVTIRTRGAGAEKV